MRWTVDTLHVSREFPRFNRSPMAMAVAAAFGTYLACTPLMAQVAESSEPTRSQSGLELGPVNIEDSYTAESPESYTVRETRSSTGLNLSPRETPQSVTSITRQQLDDRDIRTIDEALTSSAGITVNSLDVGMRNTYRARGYDIRNYRIDGLLMDGESDISGNGAGINMDLYERVDIVRGANGLLGGTGDPSAAIDLQRKRPTYDFGGSASFTYGSWDRRRVMGDINLPLTADGRLRSRLVVTQEEGGGFRDHESGRSNGALLNFELDLNEATTLGAGVQYEYNKFIGATWGANAPIWFADGSKAKVSRKTNVVADWSSREVETRTVFASLDHRFANDWQANVKVARADSDVTNDMSVAKVNQIAGNNYGGYWNANGTGAYLNGFYSEPETLSESVDMRLSGPFELFGRTHEAMIGYNSTWTTLTEPQVNCSFAGVTRSGTTCTYRVVPNSGLSVPDWRNWNGEVDKIATTKNGYDTTTKTQLRGTWAATRLSISDPLSVILGARMSTYRTYKETEGQTGTARSAQQRVSDEITPYAGVVYDLNDNYSVYASYTDIFTPQTRETSDGGYVEPVVGQSYETGIKGEWFDGSLNGSLAFFKTKQDNLAVQDIGVLTPDGEDAYKSGSGVTTQGFEIEMAGAITPNWTVYGGYTYMDFKPVDSTETTRDDPRHVIRLYTRYQLPGVLDRVTVGGGMTAQSSKRVRSSPAGEPTRTDGTSLRNPTELTQSGYALFDLMGRYQITDDTSATLNVNNLFDKAYYRNYGFYAGKIYGEPRSVSLTLRTDF